MPGAVLSAEIVMNTIEDAMPSYMPSELSKNLTALFGNLLIFLTKCQEGWR